MGETSGFPSFKEVSDEARAVTEAMALSELEKHGILLDPANYYLVGTYPPLKAMEPAEDTRFLQRATSACSVYIHIPFCAQRCTFCHFAKEILPAGERVEHYLRALHAELAMTSEMAGNPAAETIYFGGGTPSYLNAEQITALFSRLRRSIAAGGDVETTFELHPGVIDAPDYQDRLDAMAEAGVNRWVFGVQSMEDRILKKLNRGHTAGHVYRLLEMLADRNIDNLSVDLIFGLPHQTLENWYQTIRSLILAGVTKFNIFPLMLKQADPISIHYRSNPGIFADKRERLIMHFATEAIMRRIGFRRGPLFYYAKTEHHSQQQENKFDCIEDINLLPFGVSGFGYVGETQYYNECTIDRYIAAVADGRPPVWRSAHLDLDERMRRAVIFPLRSGGVHRGEFRQRYGHDPLERFQAELGPFMDHGLIAASDDYLYVTDAGAPFADSIAIKLASRKVLSRIQMANALITDLKRDPVDRYDFSPIERERFGAGVSPLRPA